LGDDSVSIVDWYASDVSAGNQGDSVGAVGFAGKSRPLAMALLRLFVGDNHAAKDLVGLMAQMLVSKAYRGSDMLLSHLEAQDMARAVLAWHRDGVCKPCGGHGYLKIEGSPSLSEHSCRACHGTKKVPFESEFRNGRVELARWLIAEVEREQVIAGKEAIKRLSLRIDQ